MRDTFASAECAPFVKTEDLERCWLSSKQLNIKNMMYECFTRLHCIDAKWLEQMRHW